MASQTLRNPQAPKQETVSKSPDMFKGSGKVSNTSLGTGTGKVIEATTGKGAGKKK